MNGQQSAILLRMVRHGDLEKWWRRREFQGSAKMRADLDNMVVERILETMEHKETLPNERYVMVTLYRLAPRYRKNPESLPISTLGA